MATKRCGNCGVEKDTSFFYVSRGSFNSRCKECCKEERKSNYRKDPEKHKAYDRERYLRPERKAQIYDSLNRQHVIHPEKYTARQKAKDAVKKGRMVKPENCSICGVSGKQIEAHHEDYNEPLVVIWACTKCHRHVIHNDIYQVGAHQ